jgi:peptidoglycan/LPS O-acetylase OafA/YrhL
MPNKKVDISRPASKKIRSLDGLRAISISMVLIAHTKASFGQSFVNSPVWYLFANSNTGVRIFFAISGYLITKLLLIEKMRTGENNLKKFYIRRVLRIFPIYYFYILIIFVVKVFFDSNIVDNYRGFIYPLTYLWNYKHLFTTGGNEGNYFGHFWSLAMEEQFYLIWPWVFIRYSRKKLIRILIIFILCMPVFRLVTYFAMPGSRGQIGMMLHTGSDSILIGCLGAFIENNKVRYVQLLNIVRKPWCIYPVILFLFIISPLLNYQFKGAYYITIGISLNNICVICFIFWSINVQNIFTKFLNTWPVTQLGILSYSIYIWHMIIVNNTKLVPLNYILILLIGITSYYFIEKPILRLKTRFAA